LHWFLKIFGGIRTRLVLLGFVAASPFVFDQFRSIERERFEEIGRIRTEARQTAAIGAQQIGAVFESARVLLSTATRVSDATVLAPDRCADELRQLLLGIDWAKSLSVASPAGTVFCSTNPHAIGASVADRAYFSAAANSRIFILSDAIRSRIDGRPIIIGALAVRNGDQPNNVMLVGIDLEKTASIVAGERRANDTEIALLDEARNAVARYPRSTETDAVTLPPAISSRIGSLTLASFDAEDEVGDNRVYAVHYLANTPARLMVGVSIEGPLRLARKAAQKAYIHTAGVALLMLLIAWVAGELLMIRPMRVLSNAAKAIGHGDLTARVNLRYVSNQFRDLATGFNFMAEQVQRLAGTDTLTTVANRREFDQRLADEWERARRAGTTLSLALIDVDRFKTLNDTLGHVAGDAALVEIGSVLSKHARRPSDLAARYGGDEFALLMAGQSLAEAARHCESVREAVENIEFTRKVSGTGLSVSIGVVTCIPRPEDAAAEFLSQVDNALYAAKAAGRNRVVARELVREAPITKVG
jgi:diguanylate cyclase (GGDEF)-like protein